MLIGLHGKKGSGKDTVYERTRVLFPHRNVVRIAFGDPLKRVIAQTFGITREQVEEFKRKEEHCRVQILTEVGNDSRYHLEVDISFRDFTKQLGTEGVRDVLGSDVWVDGTMPFSRMSRDIYRLSSSIFCVTDVRFANEAQRIRDMGGDIWHVIGPEDAPVDIHRSERPLPKKHVDDVIYNSVRNDNFESLDNQILKRIETWTPAA